MTMDTLLKLCRKYRDLGNAVADQLDAVAAGGDPSEQNGNALDLAYRRFLVDVARTDDEELAEEARELMDDISISGQREDAQQVCCGQKRCNHLCTEDDPCSCCAGRGDCTYPTIRQEREER